LNGRSWQEEFNVANKPEQPKVGILMGSDSDLDVMREAATRLDHFGIAYEMRIMSAHRTPDKAAAYASTAQERGLEVIIAGAGAAAHLAGAIAASTTLPVIGIPIDSSSLKGLDALLATVQMPAGIPVATMAIGKAGAANAGIFAAQIVARKDAQVAVKLTQFKKEMAAGVEDKDRKLQSAKPD
jgi:phosphoribosylaminoimidazole carboxylase PurE protein